MLSFRSGQAAVITPRQVISGLGSRRVKAVAAAKHHTVIATESGLVFTWGSNRGIPNVQSCCINVLFSQGALCFTLCTFFYCVFPP